MGFNIKGGVFLMLLLVLAGCHHKSRPMIEPAKLPYKVNGASDKTMQKMHARFNREGIRVVTIGQDYMISIPSSVLFPEDSPRLTWRSYALLNAVGCFLREFRKVSVNVTAFSNRCVSPQRERALTAARARAVGDYLWSQGVDGRFIFTQGLGSDKPIVALTQLGDASPNSRVEITFRDMVM